MTENPKDLTATPTPRPVPRPIPRPAPRPANAPAVSATVAVVPTADESALIEAAKKFGSVTDDGTVSVVDDGVERVIGQVPGATADDAMSLYVRRYLDLRSKVSLFETRLNTSDLSSNEISQTLTKLTDETTEPAAVGDLPALRSKVLELKDVAKKQAAAAEEVRAAARVIAIAERTKLVEQAEALAAAEPARIQWKSASDELRKLLDAWQDAQKNGPRIDRPTEEELWKRFSHARTAFDRERRHFFTQLEQQNNAAKSAKETIVAEAEALSTNTEWGATAAAYRELMTRWKAAGHASRRDDDALWSRFRAAQDSFFAARDALNAKIDEEYAANLVVKEELLVEAEALLPITNISTAKSTLRRIQDRWEDAGKVPRDAISRIEARLRAVESAMKDFEQDQWHRSNPETKARVEGAAAQLQAAISALESDLEAAKAKNDTRKVKELEEGLAARRSWFEQIVKTSQDS